VVWALDYRVVVHVNRKWEWPPARARVRMLVL